jgi:hypothetical protein
LQLAPPFLQKGKPVPTNVYEVQGRFYRTQAEARVAGGDYKAHQIDTSKQGLIDWLNAYTAQRSALAPTDAPLPVAATTAAPQPATAPVKDSRYCPQGFDPIEWLLDHASPGDIEDAFIALGTRMKQKKREEGRL